MSFIADKQSLDDLNLLGKYKANSIYSLFNRTKTAGAEKLLEVMFRTPLSDVSLINERSSIIRYFHDQILDFPFERDTVEVADRYLREGVETNFVLTAVGVLQKKMLNLAVRADEYDQVLASLKLTTKLLRELKAYFSKLEDKDDHPFYSKIAKVKEVFNDTGLVKLINEDENELSLFKIAQHQFRLRYTLQNELKCVIEVLHELDLYITLSDVARENDMGYAVALPASANRLKAKGLRHPIVPKAVANSIFLNQNENVLFLTGANMAGKSTWMKTIGLSMYLAHIGFPIAAEEFEFSIREGIYSSINVPDNLNMGYSHFYAEVLRVKEVAQQVAADKNLLVLFDELFKGTNVKDAYDATLAVSEAFAKYTNCLFVISTHIIEVGEALGERCENIQFRYLPTVMEGTVPHYTYTLKEGITSDRQGMIIIENEQILEIIDGKETQQLLN